MLAPYHSLFSFFKMGMPDRAGAERLTKKSCYAVMSCRLSFSLILTFSQWEKELNPLSYWERAEGEGSPKFHQRNLLRNIR